MRIPEVLERLADILFPRVCHLCGNELDAHTRFICPACRAELPRTGFHRLRDNAMERRFMGRFPFEQATGHFFYSRDSELASLIHDFKYRHFPGLAYELGRIIGTELSVTPFLAGVDVVVPVPLHWRKLIRRGYNQSEHIARGLADAAGIKVSTALKARRHHGTQTSLSHSQRLQNVAGIFSIDKPDELRGKGVLIIDDVCTTGATLGEAGECVARVVPDCRISLLSVGVTF